MFSGVTVWSYPAQFKRRIAGAASGALIVLEINSSGGLRWASSPGSCAGAAIPWV